MKQVLIGILILLILAAGVVVGVILVGQEQIFRQKAATPTGTASVSIQPAQASFERDRAYPITVYFNPAGTAISGVSVRLTFSNLAVTASGIQISQDLLTDGSWTCPVKSIANQGSTSQVDIACINTSTTGFTANANTLLATFNLTASQVPVVNPLIVSFDTQNSIITKKSDGQDILLTPSSTGSYTITESTSTSTATATATATATSTATATTNSTTTARPTATTTTIATSSATMPPVPESGIETPTIIGAVLGVGLTLLGAAFLIF